MDNYLAMIETCQQRELDQSGGVPSERTKGLILANIVKNIVSTLITQMEAINRKLEAVRAAVTEVDIRLEQYFIKNEEITELIQVMSVPNTIHEQPVDAFLLPFEWFTIGYHFKYRNDY